MRWTIPTITLLASLAFAQDDGSDSDDNPYDFGLASTQVQFASLLTEISSFEALPTPTNQAQAESYVTEAYVIQSDILGASSYLPNSLYTDVTAGYFEDGGFSPSGISTTLGSGVAVPAAATTPVAGSNPSVAAAASTPIASTAASTSHMTGAAAIPSTMHSGMTSATGSMARSASVPSSSAMSGNVLAGGAQSSKAATSNPAAPMATGLGATGAAIVGLAGMIALI